MSSTVYCIMVGLPGTGKSTIANRLAKKLGGVVLDKDAIRLGLFPQPWIEYSSDQDDFCMEVLLDTAAYLVERRSPPFIFIDGRPFVFRRQIEDVILHAGRMGCPVKIVHTTCSPALAQRRLKAAHIAKNRSFKLYLRLKAEFQELELPHLLLRTDKPLRQSMEQCLEYLQIAGSSRGTSLKAGAD